MIFLNGYLAILLKSDEYICVLIAASTYLHIWPPPSPSIISCLSPNSHNPCPIGAYQFFFWVRKYLCNPLCIFIPYAPNVHFLVRHICGSIDVCSMISHSQVFWTCFNICAAFTAPWRAKKSIFKGTVWKRNDALNFKFSVFFSLLRPQINMACKIVRFGEAFYKKKIFSQSKQVE